MLPLVLRREVILNPNRSPVSREHEQFLDMTEDFKTLLKY